MNLRGRASGWVPLTAAVVRGDSMLPAFRDGDWILIRRTTAVRPGQVVAAPHPRAPDRLVIKRIASARGRGWWLLGDNPTASTDSRTFGVVDRDTVLGRVVARYWPPRPPGRD